jgi:hypothetical protein
VFRDVGGDVVAAAAQVLHERVTDSEDPRVPKTSSTSCDQAVFVNQATDMSLFSDAVLAEIDWFG